MMICTSTGIFVLALSFATIQDVLPFELRMEPSHLRIGNRDNVTIMCQADVAFGDCQFTWWDVDEMTEGPRFNFKKGRASRREFLEGDNVNYHLAGYEYAGEGLEYGQCGIRLYGVMLRYRVISCRARRPGGSWQYASMSLCSHSSAPIDLNFVPEKPIAILNSSIRFLATVNNPSRNRLRKCSFRLEGMKRIIFDATNTPTCNGVKSQCQIPNTSRVVNPENPSSFDSRASYYGNGLNNGQCGLTIQNITQYENGWLFFEAETEGGGWDRRVVHLTVASPPREQNLTINNKRPAENDKVTATCSVSTSQPVASIKWMIGGIVVREDNIDDTPSNSIGNATWKWDHESQSILQTHTFIMKRKYDKKYLKCIVTHRIQSFSKTIQLFLTNNTPNTNPQLVTSDIPIRGGKLSCPTLADTDGVLPSCRNSVGRVNCFGTLFEGTQVSVSCTPGYTMTSIPQAISCVAGNWSGPLPVCWPRVSAQSAACPALPSRQGLTMVCRNEGQLVDCNRPMPTGTEVSMDPQCNSGFTILQDPGYRIIKCLATGKWDKPILECQAAPGCGKSRQLEERPSGTIDKPASYGEFPWHVAIYKRTSRGYQQICSGSLIEMDTVITVASCFWKDRYDGSFDSSMYKVVAGKIRRSWDTEEEHSQIRDIKKIVVQERYTGRDTNYHVNIAKMTLTSPMTYSNDVNVVCVDWRSERERLHFKGGQQAFVPGWAFTAEDSPGEILSSVRMPFIKYEVCNDALSPDLRRLFTGDKFCAGSTNVEEGFTMCDSDHGSGIVFYSEDLQAYEIRGIVTVPFKPITNRDTCYASRFGAFTTISVFVNWIQNN